MELIDFDLLVGVGQRWVNGVTIHELAHAIQENHVRPWKSDQYYAWMFAKNNGLYDEEDSIWGKPREGYTVANEHAYFAALLESYFHFNGEYPFVYLRLENHHESGFIALVQLWYRGYAVEGSLFSSGNEQIEMGQMNKRDISP